MKTFLLIFLLALAWQRSFAQTTSSLQQNLTATSTSFSITSNVVAIQASNSFPANAWLGISGCTNATMLNGQVLVTGSSRSSTQVVGTLYNTQLTPLTLSDVAGTADTTCLIQGQGYNPFATAPFPAPGSANCPHGNGSPGCASGPGTNTWAYDPATPCGPAINAAPCIAMVQMTDITTTGGPGQHSLVPSFTGETNDPLISLSDLGSPPEYFFSLTDDGAPFVYAGHIDPTHCGGNPCFVNDVTSESNAYHQVGWNYIGFSRNPANRPGTKKALLYALNLTNSYAPTLNACTLQYSAGAVTLVGSCSTLYNLNTCPGFGYLSVGTGLVGQATLKTDNFDNEITFALGSGLQGGFQDHMLFAISLANGTCTTYDTYGYSGTGVYSLGLTSGHAGTGWTTGNTATLPCGATATVTASGGAVTALTLQTKGSNCYLGTGFSASGAGSGLEVDVTGIGQPGLMGIIYPPIASASCPAGANTTLTCVTPAVATSPGIGAIDAYGIHSANMNGAGTAVNIAGWGTTSQGCIGCDLLFWTPSTGAITIITVPIQNGHGSPIYNWFGFATNPDYYMWKFPTGFSDPTCSSVSDCYLLFQLPSACGSSPGGSQMHSSSATPFNNDISPVLITSSVNTPGVPAQTNPPGWTCLYGANDLFTLNQPTGLANSYVHYYENGNNYGPGCSPNCENFQGADLIGTLAPDEAFWLVAEDMNANFSGNAGLGLSGTAPFVATYAIMLSSPGPAPPAVIRAPFHYLGW